MTSPALDVALSYHRAWTGKDFEKAMTYVADDIVCHTPSGRLGLSQVRCFRPDTPGRGSAGWVL